MNEQEKIDQVESFRMEIQKIVNEIKDRDATAAEIKETKELDESDMLLWEKYKRILKLIDEFDPKKSDQQATEKFIANLCELTVELKKEVAASAKKTDLSYSKDYFLNWMNNRNPFTAVNMAKTGGLDVKRLKDILADDIKLYLHK